MFDEYRRWQVELERNPVDFLVRRLPGLLAAARERLAASVGADPADLVFLPNATSGLNVIARSLELRPGDEVLASDHEYGAADLMWDLLCRRAGATYVRRPVPVPVRSAEDVVDAVWSGLTQRTRVLFVSHVSSPTALVFPIRELCRRAREAGVLALVDGAHGPGHVPLDLAALEADAYAGNCHKWLCTPKGAGFLWVRPELHEMVDSLVLGWGLAEQDASFVARNEEQGTRDPAAYLAVPAAFDFIERRGWADVRARCHDLAAEVRRRLAELTGIAPLQPDSSEWFGQMVAAELPDCDAGEVSRRLAREHRVEVYGKEWNGRPMIRVSVQGYTSADEVERLFVALPKVLAFRGIGSPR